MSRTFLRILTGVLLAVALLAGVFLWMRSFAVFENRSEAFMAGGNTPQPVSFRIRSMGGGSETVIDSPAEVAFLASLFHSSYTFTKNEAPGAIGRSYEMEIFFADGVHTSHALYAGGNGAPMLTVTYYATNNAGDPGVKGVRVDANVMPGPLRARLNGIGLLSIPPAQMESLR